MVCSSVSSLSLLRLTHFHRPIHIQRTTMGVLTGDICATKGRVFVAGHQISGAEQDGLHASVGLCPQTDPLMNLLTGRETLLLYGRIRGIPKGQLDSVVDRLLDRLTLNQEDATHKTTVQYSGGMKRKLSLGIALIGDPKVLLIDESSSGLDPLARRKMWDLISDFSKDRSVMLTTHSMEEAEALCTRAGILSNGQVRAALDNIAAVVFRGSTAVFSPFGVCSAVFVLLFQLLCLGSVQHLKTKFLDGYTIDVYCDAHSTEAEVQALATELVENALKGAHLSEQHGRFIRLDISNKTSSIGLGTMFRRLEALKEASSQWHLESYSVSQVCRTVMLCRVGAGTLQHTLNPVLT